MNIFSRFFGLFIFLSFFCFGFFTFNSLVFVTHADTLDTIISNGGGTVTSIPLPKIQSQETSEGKINHIMVTAINSILLVAGIVAVVLIIYGGVRYTLAGTGLATGDEDLINGAKQIIVYALGGLVLIIFSYAILANIIDFIETPE